MRLLFMYHKTATGILLSFLKAEETREGSCVFRCPTPISREAFAWLSHQSSGFSHPLETRRCFNAQVPDGVYFAPSWQPGIKLRFTIRAGAIGGLDFVRVSDG